MRYRFLIFTLALSLLVPLASANNATAGGDNRLVAEIKTSGRPMVVDFGKSQCTQCINQAAAIEEVRGACVDKVDFGFVHVIKESPLTASYKIFMIPTLIFLDDKGEAVSRYVGLMDAGALRDRIEDLGWADF